MASRQRIPKPRSRPADADDSSATCDPTPVDYRRWNELQTGITAEELAARDNVRLTTITRSRDIVRNFHARYSQQTAETAARRVFIEALPDAARVFMEGMQATTTITKQVVRSRHNPRTGEEEEFVDEESTIVPDHATRAKFISELTKLNQSVQPKTPLVSVDARSQTNIQQNGQLGLGRGSSLSFENIVRQIRSDQGLAIGPGDPEPAPQAAEVVDFELAAEEAQVAAEEAVEAGEYVNEAESEAEAEAGSGVPGDQ